MPQVRVRVGEVSAPVINHVEFVPRTASHAVLAEFDNVSARGGRQDRGVSGAEDLRSGLTELVHSVKNPSPWDCSSRLVSQNP